MGETIRTSPKYTKRASLLPLARSYVTALKRVFGELQHFYKEQDLDFPDKV